jgi:hypothetical protein
MNYFKVLRRHFVRKAVNKFEGASKVNVNVGNVFHEEEPEYKYGLIKKPPPKGEYYEIDHIPSKGLAIQTGKIHEATSRDPVSAYYSIKVKDTLYHVFNSARIVNKHNISH